MWKKKYVIELNSGSVQKVDQTQGHDGSKNER